MTSPTESNQPSSPEGPLSREESEASANDIEERFASLDEASRSLSIDVAALNDTLRTVAALQVEQRAQRDRQAETDRKVAQTQHESSERDRRTRRALFSVGLGLAILLPLVSALVYASLLVHVNDLLAQQNAARFENCKTRNMATLENAKREEILGRLEDNLQLKQIHLNSATDLRKGLVDCNRYKTGR